MPEFKVDPIQDQRPTIETPSAEQPSSARLAHSFILSAVVIDGATVFGSDELAQAFEPFLASRVGQPELDRIAADITNRYRKAGYLLSYAMVPEQSVQSGIVRIHVVEGFVGKVRLAGDRRAAVAVRRLFEGLAVERPLRGETLERTIGLGRGIPGVVIRDVRISRSPTDPASHLLTVAVGGDRVGAIAYLDNRGSIEGARIRGYSSFSLSSLAVPGDQVQLDLFTIPYAKFRYGYAQIRGSIPLGSSGLRLAASGSYGDQDQRLSGSNRDGFSRQLVAELDYPFAKSRAFSLTGRFLIGDWKSEQEQSGEIIQRDRIQTARNLA